MTMLAQQELMEPTPTRRIIVPTGRTGIWGVDPSSTRVAIAWIDTVTGARGVRIVPFAGLMGAARLAEIERVTQEFVDEILENGAPAPGLVLCEQPSGSNQSVNLPLIMAVGVIQAAVYAALARCLGSPVVVETITSSWWKKRACGRGDIYKPTKKKLGRPTVFMDYGVAVWARENGYDGLSWDEADAWGIAEAARRDVTLEQR